MKGTIIFIYANYSVGYLGDTRMSNSFIHLFKTLIEYYYEQGNDLGTGHTVVNKSL